jgi:hypothetical protein
MALTDAELATMSELAKKADKEDLPKVKALIQKDLHPVFQEINDGGRSAANAEAATKLAKAEEKATEAISKAAKAEADLKELREKNPDAAEQIRKAEEKVERAKEKAKEERDQLEGQLSSEREARAVSDLVKELIAAGVDPEYAGTVMAEKREIRDRIRIKDGKVEVLQKGNKELTITPADGRTAIDHLAEELVKDVADKWKTSNVSRGPAFDGLGNGGTGTGNKYDQIREAAKAAGEADNRSGTEGIARLRGNVPRRSEAKK